MENSLKSLASIILFSLALSILQAQAIKDINNLSSITFHERTGPASEFTFAITGNELNTKLSGQLGSSNSDFQGWIGNEFYDVFYSDGDGQFNSNGVFISIEVRFDLTSGGGGGNIMEVEFNFEDGSSIYASNLESFFVNGSNYNSQSESNAVDCDLSTHSTLGNTQGISQNLRLTVGIQNSYTEINYIGCIGNGYSLDINGTIYDENNPNGIEILTSNRGCDSLVNIDLSFLGRPDTTSINYQGCQNDGYSININGIIYDENNQSGTETLTSTEGCDSIVNIILNYFNPTDTTNINYQGCQNDGYFINVNGNIYDESNPSGREVIKIGNSCDSIISILLSFDSCDTLNQQGCDIYVPNAFTPNGDGNNDFFSIYLSEDCSINNFDLRIYDRWGSRIFESDNINFVWDGTFNGKQLVSNTFVWYLEYSTTTLGKIEKMKGDVIIAR